MAYALGYQGGYADATGTYGDYEGGYTESGPQPQPSRGGGGKPITWRWGDLTDFPRTEPEPAPPPPPVRIKVTITATTPRLRSRVAAVTLWPPPLHQQPPRISARLTVPPWLLYAAAAQRDAREAREMAEVAMVLELMGW